MRKFFVVLAALSATTGFGAIVERTDCSSANQGTSYVQWYDVSGVAPPPGHQGTAYFSQWKLGKEVLPPESARFVTESAKVLESYHQGLSYYSTYAIQASLRRPDGSWSPQWVLCHHFATKAMPPRTH